MISILSSLSKRLLARLTRSIHYMYLCSFFLSHLLFISFFFPPTQASEILALCDITVLSGDDSLTLPLMSVGAKGVISVMSNCSPKLVKAITEPALKGDFAAARTAHLKSFKLFKSMFIETNPQPIKAAMSLMGLCGDGLRLPMVTATDETKEILRKSMTEAGLLK